MQLTFKGRKIENLLCAINEATENYNKHANGFNEMRQAQHLHHILSKAAYDYGISEVTLNDEETLLIFGV